MSRETFNVTWDDYPAHLKIMMETFLATDSFTDVTIVCDDQKKIKSHRNVLSASSSVLENLLVVEESNHLSRSSVLYLKGIHSEDMKSVLQFIHTGVSVVTTERIDSFIDAAKNLKIKGFNHIDEDGTDKHDRVQNNLENVVKVRPRGRPQIERPVNKVNYFSNIEVENIKGEEQLNEGENVVQVSVDEILMQNLKTWENRKDEILGIFDNNEQNETETLNETVLPSAQLGQGPKHLVPVNLQNHIISSNPQHVIKFILSQRNNTQMVIDDYVLKKKKGPMPFKNMSKIYWKCVNDLCGYKCNTTDGYLEQTGQHNHDPQPDLIIKKEVRAHFKQDLEQVLSSSEEGQLDIGQMLDGRIGAYVADVVKGSDETRDNIDSHKQAVRRLKRKLMKN